MDKQLQILITTKSAKAKEIFDQLDVSEITRVEYKARIRAYIKKPSTFLEAKSQFLYLRNQQDKSQLTPPNDEGREPKKDKSKNDKVGSMIRPLAQPNLQFFALKSASERDSGLGPLTFCLESRRSTTELIPPWMNIFPKLIVNFNFLNFFKHQGQFLV